MKEHFILSLVFDSSRTNGYSVMVVLHIVSNNVLCVYLILNAKLLSD